MKEKIKLRDLCREVGVEHIEVVEVLRRVRGNVIDNDAEVITQTVGTFYASKHKARTRTLNGIVYNVPAKVVVALRGPRFPGRELEQSPGGYLITGSRAPDSDSISDEVNGNVRRVEFSSVGVRGVSVFVSLSLINFGDTRESNAEPSYRLSATALKGVDTEFSAVAGNDGSPSFVFEEFETEFISAQSGERILDTWRFFDGLTASFNLNGLFDIQIFGPTELALPVDT